MDGKVNKHNVRIQETKDLQKQREVAWDSEKNNCAVRHVCESRAGLGYFGSPIVNGASYKRLLAILFFPMFPSLPSDTIFWQEGALLYYSVEVRQLLNKKLPNFWTEQGSPTTWASLSLDLTFLAFFNGDR